jgi:peptidoglycan/xylan/chitin deacetylase (PgdA/CDA1 family)
LTQDSISPSGPIKLAISVDDLFQWVGTPRTDGYDALSIANSLTHAFEGHGVKGVYAFSNTAPTDDDRSLYGVFDHWAEQGQHVGNHTHQHASANWLPARAYIADIEKTEALIDPWMARAPVRYFRNCFDMYGDTSEKQEAVAAFLQRAGYQIAPISVWFYDAEFSIAYIRAQKVGDRETQAWLRQKFIDTAVDQLRVQAAAARLMFGRDPVHIWLIHGTAIGADCIQAILDRFQEAGVQFVSLDEALADPMNQGQPLVTSKFRNQVQKWAMLKGVPIENCPPAILEEVANVCPVEGMGMMDVWGDIIGNIARTLDVQPNMADFA